MESGQRVLVSYSASPIFLASGSWTQIRAALISQLPLRNVHWKSASRTSIRTIQQLDVNLVPLDTLRDEHTSQVPVTLLEKPLLNIYIVSCENNDVEAYKSTVRKQIKDWHSSFASRKNQEWLILHVVKPDVKMQGGNFFQLKGSVFEKLRADFNSDKRERCVQVHWSIGNSNPATWAESINKIKDGILFAFDQAVIQREDEVKRSESQRQMPGWNFCTFFILKESLPNSFEGVNLFEEALLQYDELEIAFYNVQKDKNLSWFGTLITPSPKDDSLPLLSVAKKPYRDLILANSISVFDFRIYLLGRQCELLARMGQFTEVCRKAGAFLGAFGRRLREVEATLPSFFIESWIYSSSNSVVSQCDTWLSTFPLEGSDLAAYNAGKGELIELARNQLDIIGVRAGHLPSRPPFSTSLRPLTEPSANDSTRTISNAEFLTSIEDSNAFYELYVATTNRAIDMYAKSGRRKFALKLHGSLAALDVHRGHLSTALTTFSSLPAHYAPHMWTSLESFMLSRALDTHASLNKDKDSEWIHILLSFFKTYVESLGMELLMHNEDKMAYITQLVNAMKAAALALESDLSHPDHPVMSIHVSTDARIAGTEDGSFLDVTVHNHLPCPFPVDEISVFLAGRDSERCQFSLPLQGLNPGRTKLTLFCPTSVAGIYVLDTSEIRMSRLLFRWTHRSSTKTPRLINDRPVLVRIPRDLLALEVRLRQPNQVELGKLPSLLVSVSTGRNHTSKISINLSAAGVTFQPQNAVLDGDQDSVSLETTNDSITLLDIDKDKIITFTVPHSDVSALRSMKIDISVEYVTTSEPAIVRTIKTTQTIATTLPISVNVEDFFRGTRLFSKFTISSTSHQHVRICAAHLDLPEDGTEGVKIVGCSTPKRGVVTVTPAQPANFLFYIESTGGPVRDTLTLRIKYRMLRQEVESLVEGLVQSVVQDSPEAPQLRASVNGKLVEALEQDASWIEMYGITGELNVPDSPENESDEDEIAQVFQKVKKLLHEHRHPHLPEGDWKEIKIPVDVPYMNIVASAKIRIVSTPFESTPSDGVPPLYAGQPISAILTIHTSFHWGSGANEKDRRYAMRFDVQEMVRDWLVSGRKRGDFIATENGSHTVPITLIALHHGELTLPKVVVTALPMAGEVTMGSMAIPSTETYQMHGAEKVLVLPRGGRSTFVVGMGSS